MPQSLLRLVLRHATAGSGQPRASCPTSTSSALSFTSALKGEGPAGARGGETSLSRRRPSGPASTRADNEHLHAVVAVPVSRPERRHAPAAPPRAPPLPARGHRWRCPRAHRFSRSAPSRLQDRVRRTMYDVLEHKWRMAVAPLPERFRRRTKCRFCIELRGAHAGADGESSVRLVPP